MDPRALIQPHLRDDEELLWSGAPDPRLVTRGDLFLLAWCGFAIFWESTAVAHGAPVLFHVVGIAFVTMGLALVTRTIIAKVDLKSRTAYAITTRRALIVSRRFFADTALPGRPVRIARSPDARYASVVIGEPGPQRRDARRDSAPDPGTGTQSVPPDFRFAFYDVADPEAMLRALDRARSQTAT